MPLLSLSLSSPPGPAHQLNKLSLTAPQSATNSGLHTRMHLVFPILLLFFFLLFSSPPSFLFLFARMALPGSLLSSSSSHLPSPPRTKPGQIQPRAAGSRCRLAPADQAASPRRRTPMAGEYASLTALDVVLIDVLIQILCLLGPTDTTRSPAPSAAPSASYNGLWPSSFASAPTLGPRCLRRDLPRRQSCLAP